MENITENKENCALILGGGFNGYITARELAECGVKNIFLADVKKDYAFYCNKITRTFLIPFDAEKIAELINTLYQEYNTVVVYPVSDMHITLLDNALEEIGNTQGIVLNSYLLKTLFKKSDQYRFCAEHNIAHPKTLNLRDYLNTPKNELKFPLLIKPNFCNAENYGNVFKTLVVNTEEELNDKLPELQKLLDAGINLLITEVIPGGDEELYGYVAYRSKTGMIHAEWGWRKLAQFPENYGIFSTISNQCPEEVLILGHEIFELMDFQGIGEIEFKFDARDKTYKYIETNFRTPMLSRLGHLTGVDTCYTQYLDCVGDEIRVQKQEKSKDVHYVLMQAELVNFLKRPSYFGKMMRNIFKSDKTYFAIFDWKDPMPAVMNVFYTLADAKNMIRRFF